MGALQLRQRPVGVTGRTSPAPRPCYGHRMRWEEYPPRLLSEAEVDEIREGVESGLQGPILRKWVRLFLADHDERVRLERERGEG